MRYYIMNDQNQEPFSKRVTKDFSNIYFQEACQPQGADINIELVRDRVFNRANDLVYGQALNFLDYFAELGGFRSLVELLRQGNLRSA